MLSILTIGHSNHSAGKFAGLVAAHAIEVVADTRTYPYSRFSPQFNSGRLRALLAAHGVRYLYLGKELGGRVRAEPQVFASGVARLIEEAASRRVTVLCAEEDPNRCHRRLLITPALVERGVRFVQVYSGGGPLVTQWDAHDDINGNHEKMSGHVDQPIAALLKDLKQRGLLDSTLVVWASEFGRTPMSQGGKGRDHNPYGFTMWLAGGGVKGGQAVGATDEFGLKAVEERISVHDFHATILHLLGMDHEKLTFLHNARDERLTDVAGRVVEQVLA